MKLTAMEQMNVCTATLITSANFQFLPFSATKETFLFLLSMVVERLSAQHVIELV